MSSIRTIKGWSSMYSKQTSTSISYLRTVGFPKFIQKYRIINEESMQYKIIISSLQKEQQGFSLQWICFIQSHKDWVCQCYIWVICSWSPYFCRCLIVLKLMWRKQRRAMLASRTIWEIVHRWIERILPHLQQGKWCV